MRGDFRDLGGGFSPPTMPSRRTRAGAVVATFALFVAVLVYYQSDNFSSFGGVSSLANDESPTQSHEAPSVAPPQLPLSTDGSAIVDATGKPVRLTGVNWFGAETESQVVHGLWERPYRDLIDTIAESGFNVIRMPFSNEMLRTEEPISVDNLAKNSDLEGLTPLEVMDAVIEEAADSGLMVILDRHRPRASGQTALWWTPEVKEKEWIADWQMLADRYANQPAVVGADLHNEPHDDPEGDACWGCGEKRVDWHAAAERAGAAIQEKNKDWLIVVQGVQSVAGSNSTWWGGNLSGVREHPVELPVPDKVVYSPHEYATSVADQPWLFAKNFPDNMTHRWDEMWGYLLKEDIAPILLGEFGSTMIDERDRVWFTELMGYLGKGPRAASFAYWSLNPNSQGTLGILEDDWVSLASPRYELLEPYLDGPSTLREDSGHLTEPIDGGIHVDNPYAGARSYRNPLYVQEVEEAAAESPADIQESMVRVAKHPTAIWLDSTASVIGGAGVEMDVRAHLDEARLQATKSDEPLVITLVLNNLPNRSCTSGSRNGEFTVSDNGLFHYQNEYIDQLNNILAKPRYRGIRIAMVLEPDSLLNLVTDADVPACQEALLSDAYVDGFRYVFDQLSILSNVYTYVDLGNAGWAGWDSTVTAAAALVSSTAAGAAQGPAAVDGFALNVSNYVPIDEPYLDTADQSVGGTTVSASRFYDSNPLLDSRDQMGIARRALIEAGMPESIGFIVDTSRNGWGGPERPGGPSTSSDINEFVDTSRIDRRAARGNWCNQEAGIGARPVADPVTGIDAFMWIKPPGESDGTGDPSKAARQPLDPACTAARGAMDGAPPAGEFFREGLERLVRDADPAL